MSKLRKAAQDVVYGYFHEVPSLYNEDTHHKNISRLEAALANEPDLRKLVRAYRDAESMTCIAEQDGTLSDGIYQLRVAELNAKTAMFLAVEEADNEKTKL